MLYVYRVTNLAAQYYATRGLRFPGEVFIGLRGGVDQAERDVEALRGRQRVWVLFSHVMKPSGLDEERFFLQLLDRAGARLDVRRATGAALYLYDVSRTVEKE
jgi:hypothetical protein